MSTYLTRDGDVIDALCKERYGREDMVHAVYGENAGLAAYGPVLPKGLTVAFPTAPHTPVKAPLRLWGRHEG